jgi:hypothetical protein
MSGQAAGLHPGVGVRIPVLRESGKTAIFRPLNCVFDCDFSELRILPWPISLFRLPLRLPQLQLRPHPLLPQMRPTAPGRGGSGSCFILPSRWRF